MGNMNHFPNRTAKDHLVSESGGYFREKKRELVPKRQITKLTFEIPCDAKGNTNTLVQRHWSREAVFTPQVVYVPMTTTNFT